MKSERIRLLLENQVIAPDSFMDILEQRASWYFQRGYNAVIENRIVRTFDEACEIIENCFRKAGVHEALVDMLPCAFAQVYIAGVEAARKDVHVT